MFILNAITLQAKWIIEEKKKSSLMPRELILLWDIRKANGVKVIPYPVSKY